MESRDGRGVTKSVEWYVVYMMNQQFVYLAGMLKGAILFNTGSCYDLFNSRIMNDVLTIIAEITVIWQLPFGRINNIYR